MAKPKGSKLVTCPTCGKRLFMIPGSAKTCKCGAMVSAPTVKA